MTFLICINFVNYKVQVSNFQFPISSYIIEYCTVRTLKVKGFFNLLISNRKRTFNQENYKKS